MFRSFSGVSMLDVIIKHLPYIVCEVLSLYVNVTLAPASTTMVPYLVGSSITILLSGVTCKFSIGSSIRSGTSIALTVNELAN